MNGITPKDIDRLAMEIAVEMEIHAACSTSTRAKGDDVAKRIAAFLEDHWPAASEQPPVDNDHIADGGTRFTDEEIALNA
jgi:hypothetical protein